MMMMMMMIIIMIIINTSVSSNGLPKILRRERKFAIIIGSMSPDLSVLRFCLEETF
jgi:hypothetical protein